VKITMSVIVGNVSNSPHFREALAFAAAPCDTERIG